MSDKQVQSIAQKYLKNCQNLLVRKCRSKLLMLTPRNYAFQGEILKVWAKISHRFNTNAIIILVIVNSSGQLEWLNEL